MTFAFPADIYRQLLGVDHRLLDELTFLARKQAQRSPSGARYCIPSRTYLAAKLGVCVRTVSRSVARLKRLGIIDAIQRRPVQGIWRTNLYKVKHWLGWRIGQMGQLLRAKLPKAKHRGTPMAHIASRKREMKTSEPRFSPKTEPRPPCSTRLTNDPTWKRWMARGETP